MEKHRHKISVITLLFLYALTYVWYPVKSSDAKAKLPNVEEGVYSLDYVILHAETDSVSIANDYFEKPAIYIVHNGEHYIRFTLNHSEWTKELQAPIGDSFVDVKVIREDKKENTRVVQFKVDRDLTEPIEFKMHVLIESMEPVYDHRYTVRFNFDLNSLEKLDQQAIDTLEIKEKDFETTKEQKTTKKSKESETKISNFIIIFMVFLMILAFVIIYMIRKTNKKKKENSS
ncbi:NEAT domain-containing protein [Virgibacillus proomii]|uniref:NEAT domain-containing protein n=1 Tax=Virgibacillus proomii TaxID=84407 RepID=UPI001C118C18|nr:NEAT domain-containing protein [Virgibacillus proomii]MBU5266687.1 NEAT domain-containing protein [Virgibacillus proomii]